jgi:hypothetical protein
VKGLDGRSGTLTIFRSCNKNCHGVVSRGKVKEKKTKIDGQRTKEGRDAQ